MPERTPDEFIGSLEAIARTVKTLDVSEGLARDLIERATTRGEISRWCVFGKFHQTDLYRQDFETWLTRLAGSMGTNGNGKNKGGRPPGYDYEGALIELARFVYDSPKGKITEESLLQQALAWFPDGGPQNQAKLKELVRRFYEKVIGDSET